MYCEPFTLNCVIMTCQSYGLWRPNLCDNSVM
uniref:Uncharacterized protein n=1 Tax=Aegilops tauschii subsp. strangulata TaxID=200361 RepID=A0A453JS35_AEGTS